jgi:hypothetical protein
MAKAKYRIFVQYTTDQGFEVGQGYGPVYGKREAEGLIEFFKLDLARKGFDVKSIKAERVV